MRMEFRNALNAHNATEQSLENFVNTFDRYAPAMDLKVDKDWDEDEDEADDITPIDEELLHAEFSYEDEEEDEEDLTLEYPAAGDLDDFDGDDTP